MIQIPTTKRHLPIILLAFAIIGAIMAALFFSQRNIPLSTTSALVAVSAFIAFLISQFFCHLHSRQSLVDAFFNNIARGEKSEIKKKLDAKPSLIRSTDKNGCNPLHRAILEGRYKTASLLLSRGANANAQEQTLGLTPMHILASLDYKPVIAAFHPRQHPKSTKPLKGQDEDMLEIIDLLVQHGADVNKRAGFNRSPLHMAAMSGFIQVVRALLRKGADPMACDDLNFTPLHYAAYGDHVDIARDLLGAGAKIEATAELGYTPLHTAAERGAAKVAVFLLENGADLSRTTTHGRTAASLAAQHNHVKLTEILQKPLFQKKEQGND
jgi:ankyrin repeat protein